MPAGEAQFAWTMQENGSVMWKYMLAWILMVFIAIANGAIREGWYGKHMSELQAHQILRLQVSCCLGSTFGYSFVSGDLRQPGKLSPLVWCGSA
jgi:hypothetical protein